MRGQSEHVLIHSTLQMMHIDEGLEASPRSPQCSCPYTQHKLMTPPIRVASSAFQGKECDAPVALSLCHSSSLLCLNQKLGIINCDMHKGAGIVVHWQSSALQAEGPGSTHGVSS